MCQIILSYLISHQRLVANKKIPLTLHLNTTISMHSMVSFKSKELIVELVVGGKVTNIHSIIVNPAFS